jgi:hypothetical protein
MAGAGDQVGPADLAEPLVGRARPARSRSATRQARPARLLTTLLASLERAGGRYGLLTMCEGGGQANVTIIERVGSTTARSG